MPKTVKSSEGTAPSKAQQGRWLDEYCHTCGQQLNTWDKRCSKALAYRSLVCESCIAKEYDRTVDDMRDMFEGFFGMRPCMGI